MRKLKAYTYDDMLDGVAYVDIEYYPKSDVDAAIAELKDENRRLKRALWMSRANRAMAEPYSVLNDVLTSNRWVKALNKLKAKAEEYK